MNILLDLQIVLLEQVACPRSWIELDPESFFQDRFSGSTFEKIHRRKRSEPGRSCGDLVEAWIVFQRTVPGVDKHRRPPPKETRTGVGIGAIESDEVVVDFRDSCYSHEPQNGDTCWRGLVVVDAGSNRYQNVVFQERNSPRRYSDRVGDVLGIHIAFQGWCAVDRNAR